MSSVLPAGLFPVGCDTVGDPLLRRRRSHKALAVKVSETLGVVGRAAYINIFKFLPYNVCKVVWVEFVHLFIYAEKANAPFFITVRELYRNLSDRRKEHVRLYGCDIKIL